MMSSRFSVCTVCSEVCNIYKHRRCTEYVDKTVLYLHFPKGPDIIYVLNNKLFKLCVILLSLIY